MKKLLIGLLALGSISSFALETTCMVTGRIFSNIDASYNKDSKKIHLRYVGNSTLEIKQNLVDGFEGDLRLTGFSRTSEVRVGNKVKRYDVDDYEKFTATFRNSDKGSDKEIRLQIHEDKTFKLFIDSFETGKELHAYKGKCKSKLTKEEAKMMVEDIRIANEKAGN